MLCFWLMQELRQIDWQLHTKKLKSHHTGKQTAEDLFALAHLRHVRVLISQSDSVDYYDTGQKVICLSDETASEPSIAATGIVAHEVGHALQDKEGYWLIRRSEIIIGLKIIAGNIILPAFIAGLFLDFIGLVLASWILFIFSVICNILLYLLHSDASRRGVDWLRRDKYVSKEEDRLIEKFLRTTNLTYLGDILITPLQILFTLRYAFGRIVHFTSRA